MQINNAVIDSGFFGVYINNKKFEKVWKIKHKCADDVVLFLSQACLLHIHLIEKYRLKTKTLYLLKWESTVNSHVHICQLHQHRPSQWKCSRNSNVDRRGQHEISKLTVSQKFTLYQPNCFKLNQNIKILPSVFEI